MFRRSSWIFGCLVLLCVACTPKTGEKTGSTEEDTPATSISEQPEEELSPCPKFSDAPDPDEAETNYVLYRDYLRLEEFTKAYEYWQKVYAVAPAADGRRNTVLTDGIRFYENLARGEEDSLIRKKYVNLVFDLYDQLQECYPEGGYVDGRKAFDFYYEFPNLASKEEIYALFKKSIDTDGLDAHDFIINPFASLLVELYFEGKVTLGQARKYQQLIRDVVAKGVAECEGTGCDRWKIVEGYAPARLEAFETVKGFYDCRYFEEKYLPEFEENPSDCDVIRTVYSRLVWGGCPDTDEALSAVVAAAREHCVEETEGPFDHLRNARYPQAIAGFEEYVKKTEDIEKKAYYSLLIAKIYYAHLKSYSKARQYARQALSYRSDWGEPYILIGKLYASSGPLCGPGRGWDSQIVTWVAIDKWQQAKRVDPSSASEANKLIYRYSAFMPSREEIFQRNLTEGSSFKVGCWIQESTTIRAAPRR